MPRQGVAEWIIEIGVDSADRCGEGIGITLVAVDIQETQDSSCADGVDDVDISLILGSSCAGCVDVEREDTLGIT